MKKTPIILTLCGILLLGGAYVLTHRPGSSHTSPAGDSTDSETAVYTCPMHPSVRTDRPGACPICGMALVRQSRSADASAGEIAALRSVSLSPSQRVMTNISTIESRRQTIAHDISAVGVVAFAEPRQATVAARFGGRIERLYVNSTGQIVKQGEPLFALYSPDLITAEQEYLLAREGTRGGADSSASTMNHQLLESARERLLLRFGLTSPQIDQLRESGRVGSAAIFTSPISGTVIRKDVQEGQFVQEGTILYELADLSRVWVLLDVYEQDIRFVKVGNEVTLTAPAYPGERFRGRVVFVEPVVSAETRTVRVRLDVPNPFGKLRPNMYVSGTITVRKDNAIAVPRQSVLNTGRQSVVWVEVVKNGFEPRTVTTGIVGETFVEILSGLRGGERVAATGGFLLDSESALSAPSSDESVSSAPVSHGERARAGENWTDVEIRVDGGYFPEVAHVKAGLPVRLHFTRIDSSECTREVVFKSLGIRRELPTGKTTTIEFTPGEVGEIQYECGMAMLEGKIIVDPR
jgi:Cu(I)/Ag(I) efflux system membrane fusion protein